MTGRTGRRSIPPRLASSVSRLVAIPGFALMGPKPDFTWLAGNCKETTGTCAQLHNGETLPDPPQDRSDPRGRDRRSRTGGSDPEECRRDQDPFPVLAVAVRRSWRGRRFARGARCGLATGQARHSRRSGRPLRLPRAVHGRSRPRPIPRICTDTPTEFDQRRHFTANSTRRSCSIFREQLAGGDQ